MKQFEILEHTADLKIKAWGKDLPEVFVNLAKGIASQQLGVAERSSALRRRFASLLRKEGWREIEIKSPDLESLLVDWLNEILYQGEINQKVYLDFQILEFSSGIVSRSSEASDSELRAYGGASLRYSKSAIPYIRAKIRGQPVQTKNIEIKAATYHDLEIKKLDNQWQAVVVFDI